MRVEAVLVVVGMVLCAGGCKTYTAIPFDAGDANGDSIPGLAGDGGLMTDLWTRSET